MKYRPLRSLPSAVQVWFEEQLEALGVDSALYTRYILSLMYADPSDIINAEDECIIAGLNQEGNKRLRRAKSWRKYAYVDADQIKRSAVVECLMTAAEQNCEVEALVDQLCEKLREVHSENDVWPSQDTKVPVPDEDEHQMNKKISPTELAQKYYAAFPPLSQKSDLYFSSNISLVLDKWPSNKSNTNLIAAKWTPPGSSKKSKRRYNNNQPLNENTMKTPSRDNQNRNRFGHKRTHCGRDLSKEAADPSNHGNFVVVVECTPPNRRSPVAKSSERDRPKRIGNADTQEGRMKLWLANAECKDPNRPIKKKNMVKRRRLFENNNQHPRSPVPLYSRALWSLPTEDLKRDALARYVNDLYSVGEKADNQPFTTTLDIEPEISALREEYQRSPGRKLDDDEDEIAIKEEYKRPRQRVSNQGVYADYMGRDSLEEKVYNGDWEDEQCDGDCSTVQFWDTYSKARRMILGKMGDLQKQDVEFMKQRRINDLLVELGQSSKIAVPRIRQRHDSHPRDVFHPLSLSLLTINHSSNSAFCEYRPPLLAKAPLHSNPFNSLINQPSSSLNPPNVSEDQNRQTHFQPLDVLIAREERKKKEERKIKDGTTFDVQSSIDEVKFERSDSGTLCLQTEFGEMRKYYDFKMQTPNDELMKMPKIRKSVGDPQFQVKFWLSKNDKACQTDDPSDEAVLGPLHEERKLLDTDLSESTTKHDLSVWIPPPPHPEELNPSNSDPTEVDGLCGANKVVWGDAPKNSSLFCKHCIVNHPWPANLPQYTNCDLKHIWAGTEKSDECPWRTIVPTPQADRSSSKLREEIREEAERLLSDLNSLHLSNLGGCRYLDSRGLNGSAEKIRRHSFMDSAWSFASLLQEDRLVSLPIFPSRRSVTL
ncbi:uncharacterized protein [Euwallacea fornicatus]|uniref:uncharacterized protein isoform X4 n=1 Tax=Euwallacea fornicatus TaxID=995702 RepID=UPI00338E3FEB